MSRALDSQQIVSTLVCVVGPVSDEAVGVDLERPGHGYREVAVCCRKAALAQSGTNGRPGFSS